MQWNQFESFLESVTFDGKPAFSWEKSMVTHCSCTFHTNSDPQQYFIHRKYASIQIQLLWNIISKDKKPHQNWIELMFCTMSPVDSVGVYTVFLLHNLFHNIPSLYCRAWNIFIYDIFWLFKKYNLISSCLS